MRPIAIKSIAAALITSLVFSLSPTAVHGAGLSVVKNAGLFASNRSVYSLPLFETSDIHGYLADTSSSPYEYRLAYISDKVRDARTVDGVYRKDRAVLVDGGDIFQGNTISNLLKGHSLSAAFQMMDYDAVTIGNHEFDWGIENVIDPDGTLLDSKLDDEVVPNTVPVVASNIYLDRKKISFASDYVILEKKAADEEGREVAVKVAVIGFSGDHSSSILYTNFTGAGYDFSVNYAMVNRIADELESTGQADVTILLVHDEAADAASSLGFGTKVDFVLGGHTHASKSGQTILGLKYAQPAANGTAYVYSELTFELDKDGNPVFSGVKNVEVVNTTNFSARMRPTEENASELDPAVKELTDRVIEEISDLLNGLVGYIDVSARKNQSIAGSGGRSTTMGNWMASITARAVGADIGFYNGGGVRTEFIIPGGRERLQITVSDIYTMFPFQNRIYCYEITYEELLTVLKYALTSSGSTLFSRMTGIDCYYMGQTVQALVRNGTAIYYNGEWKDHWKDRTVKIGVSEFIATTDRKEGSLSNPLIAWTRTGRLVSRDTVDVEGAFRVLDEESEANKWKLTVDEKTYFIEGVYKEPGWTTEDTGWDETEAETIEPIGENNGPAEGDPANGQVPDRGFEPDLPDQPFVPMLILVILLIAAVNLVAAAVVLIVVLRKKRAAEKEKNKTE